MSNIFSRLFGRDDQMPGTTAKTAVGKFNRLYWHPKYTVHDEVLDRQHQNLFAITNRVIDKYESGSVDSYDTIQELVVFISEHFYAEQVVMIEARYWAYNQHVQEHEYFIKKVETFLRRHKDNEKELIRDIVNFLRDWIFVHTTNSDLKYGEVLQKNQAHE
jgi:hemerythrin